MKTIARVIAILAAALAVAGLAYAIGQSSYAEGLVSSMRPEGGRPQAQVTAAAAADGAADSSAVSARPEGEGGGHNQSPSLAGGVEVLKDLGIIGAIIAVVSLGTGLLRRLTGGRRPRPPAAQMPAA